MDGFLDPNRIRHPSYKLAQEKGKKYFGWLIGLATLFTTTTVIEMATQHESIAVGTVFAGVTAVGGLGVYLNNRNNNNLAQAEHDFQAKPAFYNDADGVQTLAIYINDEMPVSSYPETDN